MKNLKKVIQTALDAQKSIVTRLQVEEISRKVESEFWISEHEAIQSFLQRCSELNLQTIESAYDKLLLALLKGTKSKDQYFLQYVRSQQDALIQFCIKTGQDFQDEEVSRRYFTFEVLEKYDSESIEFWASFT